MTTSIPRRRLSLFLLFFGLLFLVGCGSSISLISGLSEEQANQIIEVLQENDIPATKEESSTGIYQIDVEPNKFGEAIRILKMAGLPREKRASIGDIFKKEGLISSPFEERVRYAYALSQSLQDTIDQIDGVISSKVHIALPETRSATPNQVPSAAVFILYNPEVRVETNRSGIRKLVANSVAGLGYDHVSITFSPIGVGSHGQEPIENPLAKQLPLEKTGVNKIALSGLLILALAGTCFLVFWKYRDRMGHILNSRHDKND